MWAVYKKNLKHISILRWHMFCPEYLYWFSEYTFNSDNVQSGTGYCPVVFGGQLYFASFWLVMLIPILTMRVFAEERRNGTEVC